MLIPALIVFVLLVPVDFIKAQTNQELMVRIAALTQLVQTLQAQLQSQFGNTIAIPNSTFTNPVLVGSTNQSILLLQQVLATDPQIYPEGMITGYFGGLTEAAIRRLQTKFGSLANGRFSAETSYALTTALSQIPLATYPQDYLRRPQVIALIQQAIVTFRNNNQTQTTPGVPTETTAPIIYVADNIRSITAVRDYKANLTKVQIFYSDNPVKRLTLSVVEPRTAVVSEIASQLGLLVTDIDSKVLYSTIRGKELKKLILIVTLSTKMDLDITSYDGTRQLRPITESDINDFVVYSYRGDFDKYNTDFAFYVDRARQGLPVEPVYELVANALGNISKAEVKEKLEFNVEPYLDNNDPQTGG